MSESFELQPSPARETATQVVVDTLDRAAIAEQLDARMGPRRRVVVADENVLARWPDALPGADEAIALPAGEAAKNADVLIDVCRELARREVARDASLVSFGGGACGDLTGMAASIYMRGIAVAHIPTSLLAMVDASLGGKCAIDIPEGKNLVGSFWTPRLLLVDPRFLATLAPDELRAGFGEIAKYALGFDAELFERLRAMPAELVDDPARAAAEIEDVVVTCLRIKARVVEADMHESAGGVRVHLNLGHTIAHAIEAFELERGRLVAHGLAVAFGLRVAARLALARGRMAHEDVERFEALLDSWSMPQHIRDLCPDVPSEEALATYCRRDKKVVGSSLRTVIPLGIGRGCNVEDVDAEELARFALSASC